MGSGTSKVRNGAFKGSGAALEVRQCDFRPTAVQVINEDGLCQGWWTNTMADGDVMKQVTDGTISKVTTNGITPLSDGFSLGADADLNVAGELVHWIAYE